MTDQSLPIPVAFGWTEQSRVLCSALIGVVVAVPVAFVGPWQLSTIIWWDVTALVFVVWTWVRLWRLDGEGTRVHALREDASRGASRILMAAAAMASLAGVITALVMGRHASGVLGGVLTASSIITVMISWVLIHTLFTLRYADLYYRDIPGGIDFSMEQLPTFHDFAYVAFTVGMTFQIADTTVTDQQVRRSVLVHSLLAYVFGTVILGMTINVIAGLF